MCIRVVYASLAHYQFYSRIEAGWMSMGKAADKTEHFCIVCNKSFLMNIGTHVGTCCTQLRYMWENIQTSWPFENSL